MPKIILSPNETTRHARKVLGENAKAQHDTDVVANPNSVAAMRVILQRVLYRIAVIEDEVERLKTN